MSRNYDRKTTLDIIEAVCESSQNEEMIAEHVEYENNDEYNEERAALLLGKMKKILIDNIDKLI